ncbi:MAG: hypothetical protein MR867_08840 [Eubacterium sp.]|nr:hypothetical protein [Eubacterium sp.]MDD7210474.1 hypothetical protein [Lachnospiraceae bacterium]MDY5497880.1 hypothetical protein [Anaerobutyricum sp.]
MINLQKIADYIDQNNISEEDFYISTGLSRSFFDNVQGSLSAQSYLEICDFLNVSPWMFYEKELNVDDSDS